MCIQTEGRKAGGREGGKELFLLQLSSKTAAFLQGSQLNHEGELSHPSPGTGSWRPPPRLLEG